MPRKPSKARVVTVSYEKTTDGWLVRIAVKGASATVLGPFDDVVDAMAAAADYTRTHRSAKGQ